MTRRSSATTRMDNDQHWRSSYAGAPWSDLGTLGECKSVFSRSDRSPLLQFSTERERFGEPRLIKCARDEERPCEKSGCSCVGRALAGAGAASRGSLFSRNSNARVRREVEC
jgi:hypothetical protein